MTFVKHAAGPGGVCWLKDVVRPPSPHTGMMSAVKHGAVVVTSARITFDSDPPGATVKLVKAQGGIVDFDKNARTVGMTPVTIALPADDSMFVDCGDIGVLMIKNGFAPHTTGFRGTVVGAAHVGNVRLKLKPLQ